ncbi:MAG: DNA polymerase III subunit delta, partial [Verrucomicrobiota bacterium]
AAVKLAEKLAPKSAGEFGVEIIDGTAGNQDEALKIFARLHEALNTVGFFGATKLVWLKSTNLLADDKAVVAEAVKDGLTELGETLKRGLPDGVTLLISAIGFDKRRSLAKTLEKLAEVKLFDAPDESKQAGDEDIADFIQKKLRAEGKTMTNDAVATFRELVAPNLREIANELEKLCLYAGQRAELTDADVRGICSVSRQSVIWELTDALGARRLPQAIAALDRLLDDGEEPLGIVAMLVNQIRLMLLARDLIERKLITVRDGYGGNFEFVKAFGSLPADATAHFPRNKDGALPNAWRFYRCAVAAKNFSSAELIRALELILEANWQLVSTQLDDRLVLTGVITKIARK